MAVKNSMPNTMRLNMRSLTLSWIFSPATIPTKMKGTNKPVVFAMGTVKEPSIR